MNAKAVRRLVDEAHDQLKRVNSFGLRLEVVRDDDRLVSFSLTSTMNQDFAVFHH
jgi:hypothetical protein